MSPNLLSEIARLEAELARIGRELDVLKRQAGVPSSKRTQSFAALHHKDAATREMPASTPPNAPPDRPQPSIPVSSEVVPKTKSDRRVQAGGRTGLSDYPPSTPAPTRRAGSSSPAPDAGRYEFVGEGSSRRRR